MFSLRAPLALACLASLACSSPPPDSVALAINDPLDLIDDVSGPLRLLVLPAAGFGCDASTGRADPEPPDLAEGMLRDAVADLSLEVSGSMAGQEVQVPPGAYVVLVRGKGTDLVSGRSDVFIATACAEATIESGQTIEVRLTLMPIFGAGVCGDGVFSPDEHCDDSNTIDGDGCSASCRTEPFAVNTTTAGSHEEPAVGGAPEQRWLATFDSGRTDVRMRLLGPAGGAITSPGALATDATIGDVVPSEPFGIRLLSAAAVARDGRIAIAYTTFTSPTAIRVAFFNRNRTPEAGSVLVRSGAGAEPRASLAFAGDGALLIAFDDAASATGISAHVFAPGARSPIASQPFVVGAGTTDASAPAVAAASDRFAVAFVAGGDVYAQRFDADGEARDASPIAVATGASTQDQPTIAALADGRALVAWRESGGDGSGSAVRARMLDDTGPGFVLNTTTSGEQIRPRAAAGASVFLVAFESEGTIRGRTISGDGAPLPNREQPPTTADFAIASAGARPAVATGGPNDAPRALVVWAEAADVRGRLFPIP